MKKFALALAWLAVIFCFICLPAYGFQVCNIFFALAGILFVPDGVLSRALSKHLKIKPAFIYLSASVLLLMGVFTAPGLVFGRENAAAQLHGTTAATVTTTQASLQSSITSALTTGPTNASSATSPTETQATVQTAPQSTTQSASQATTPIATTYILNTNSKTIHIPGCYAAKKILETNKAEYTGDFSELLAQGYKTCGICFKK